MRGRRIRGEAWGARAVAFAAVAASPLWALASFADEPGALVSAQLAIFDGRGSGDRDGRVEWPDLNPEAIAARIAGGGAEAAALRAALISISAALRPDCVRERTMMTAPDVRCVFDAVAENYPASIARETLNDQIGALRTDSLRGIHDGADPPVREAWLWAHLILNGLGVPAEKRVQSGFAGGFPVDPDRVEGWFPRYLGLTGSLAASLLCGGTFADHDTESSQVSIRGRTSATLHEAVSTPCELEKFRSPGMLFMHGEILAPATSLVESGVRYIQRQSAKQHAPPGGFFLSTYGANDLFSFRHVVIGAPEVQPRAFANELTRLDEQTQPLVALGVRRIYVVPPPVDAVFLHHRMPDGARFTDGARVPPGSVALHHWWLAANAGRRLPRNVVLSAEQLVELRARQDAFARAANDVLGVKSNWLVVDTRDTFRKLLGWFYAGFPPVDAPGYGRIEYAGATALLSTDSVHPTELGYLLWAEMVLEELREGGVSLAEDAPLEAAWKPRSIDEKIDALLRRVKAQIRLSPSFFRPRRFPADPSWAPRVAALARDADAFDAEDAAAWPRAYADATWVWPYIPEYLLKDIAPRIDPAIVDARARGDLQHHQIVDRLRRVLEAPGAWTAERRASMRELLRTFVDDGELATRRHARASRAVLSALAGDPDRFDEGSTPALAGGRRTFALALEALGRTTNATRERSFWAGAHLDAVPLRTPLSFVPAGTDFATIEGHLGLAATLPASGAEPAAKAYVEASVAPAVTTFFDDLPDLALTIEMLSWRPAFAFGEPCRAFSNRCTALGRISEGLQLSFWPFRDPAFGVDRWPALYAGARISYAPSSLALGGVLFEGSAGASATF